MEHQVETNEKSLGFWLALLVALFVGVLLIFALLKMAIPEPTPKEPAQIVETVEQETAGKDAPSFCLYCGEGRPESFAWGQYCPWCGEHLEA